MWSHLDLETEGPGPGPEAAVRASWGVFTGHLGAPPLSSGRHKAAEYHGHHPRAITGGQAKSAGACPERRCCGALEICPRGPRRHLGLGLGSWLCHHSPLEPMSHHCRPAKGLDHRWLPSVVKSRLPGRIKSGAPQPAREGSLSPWRGSEGAGTFTEQQLRKVIQRKLVAYKRQDAAKTLRFNLKVDHIL